MHFYYYLISIFRVSSVADVNYTPSPRHLVHGDEDYEDGLTIISRLGEIENCRSPHCSNVSVVCNCEKTVQSDSHTSTVDETEHTSEQDGRLYDGMCNNNSFCGNKSL